MFKGFKRFMRVMRFRRFRGFSSIPPAPLQNPGRDLVRRGRVLAEAQRVQRLVDECRHDMPASSAARSTTSRLLHTRTTRLPGSVTARAPLAHALVSPPSTKTSPGQVILKVSGAFREVVGKRVPSLVVELGQQRLTAGLSSCLHASDNASSSARAWPGPTSRMRLAGVSIAECALRLTCSRCSMTGSAQPSGPRRSPGPRRCASAERDELTDHDGARPGCARRHGSHPPGGGWSRSRGGRGPPGG